MKEVNGLIASKFTGNERADILDDQKEESNQNPGIWELIIITEILRIFSAMKGYGVSISVFRITSLNIPPCIIICFISY